MLDYVVSSANRVYELVKRYDRKLLIFFCVVLYGPGSSICQKRVFATMEDSV